MCLWSFRYYFFLFFLYIGLRTIESPPLLIFYVIHYIFFYASFSYGGEISMKAKVNNSTTITTHQNIPQQRLKSILSSRILFSISLLFESVIGNNKLKKKGSCLLRRWFFVQALWICGPKSWTYNLTFLGTSKRRKLVVDRILYLEWKKISSWNNRPF